MTTKELHAKLYPHAAAKQEYIICAAIHVDDELSWLHQPENITTGIVLCGWRHDNIWYNWIQLSTGKTRRTVHLGFLTSKNRFVNRKEAAAIAFDAGQIPEPSECLLSDDLY